jgi:hypothetical protein
VEPAEAVIHWGHTISTKQVLYFLRARCALSTSLFYILESFLSFFALLLHKRSSILLLPLLSSSFDRSILYSLSLGYSRRIHLVQYDYVASLLAFPFRHNF